MPQQRIASTPSPSKSAMTPTELLRIMNAALPMEDVSEVLRESHHMSTDALAEARWLLTTAEYKRLLNGPEASLLLIDGHCAGRMSGKVSPLSVLCTSLAAALLRAGCGRVVQFYCGGHSNTSKSRGGTKGLLRSAITQLLVTNEQNLPPLDFIDQSYARSLAGNDFVH